jgi:hypothetical protein
LQRILSISQEKPEKLARHRATGDVVGIITNSGTVVVGVPIHPKFQGTNLAHRIIALSKRKWDLVGIMHNSIKRNS